MSMRQPMGRLAATVLVGGFVILLVARASGLPGIVDYTSQTLKTSVPNDSEFLAIPLGHSISSWYPVDLDQDGTVEFAVTIKGSPASVGLFDPGSRRWLDGPRTEPPGTIDWGVRRSTDGGSFEYYFLAGRTLFSYDSRTQGLDSVWTFGYAARTLTVWGHDQFGEAVVAATGDSVNDYLGRGKFLRVHSLSTGAVIATMSGGDTKPRLAENYPEFGQQSLVIHRARAEIYSNPEISQAVYSQWLYFVDEGWSIREQFELPSWWTYGGPPHDLWGLKFYDVGFLTPNAAGVVAWLTESFRIAYGEIQPMYGVYSSGGTYLWNLTYWQRNLYTGLAIHDFDGDGNAELVLPLGDSSGWQLRNPRTGAKLHVVADLPPVSVFTYPLAYPDRGKLFYITDSTLKVFQPDSLVEAEDTTGGEPLPTDHLTLAAYPNPFNSTVTLIWASVAPASALTIHNILGQSVRSFDASTLSGTSSVTWDGLDGGGRPVASGVYFARLVTKRQAATAKLVLLR